MIKKKYKNNRGILLGEPMKQKTPLYVLLLAVLLSQIYYTIHYWSVWGDVGVYIGMGKYMFGGGAIGYWELARPILWPFFLGLAWKFNINPLIAGKIIVLLFSLGAIYITYLLGKNINEETGLLAATLLSFTPVYFTFTAMQLTDIISLFFSLLAIFLTLKERYFFSGLSVGIAFNFRFPHAITFVVINAYLFFLFFRYENIKAYIKRILFLFTGAALLIIPYFILNYFLYGNAFLPLIQAQKVVGYTIFPGRGISYYFIELLKNNPFLFFSVIGIVFYFLFFKERPKTLDLIVLAAAIITAYFVYEPHKELRYAIAFLPYLCLLSAFAIWTLLKHIIKIRTFHTVFLLLTLTLFVIASVTVAVTPQFKDNIDPRLEAYYRYFQDHQGVTVFGYDSQFLAYSDMKLVRYTYWPAAARLYQNLTNIDYITVNTCPVYCKPTSGEDCYRKRDYLLKQFSQYSLVYNETANKCNLMIYKVNLTQS